MATPKQKLRWWKAVENPESSSGISGTRRRITHEIDSEYGSSSARGEDLRPRDLERRPADVPTLRAPRPSLGEPLGRSGERPDPLPEPEASLRGPRLRPFADWVRPVPTLVDDGEIELGEGTLTPAELIAVAMDALGVSIEIAEGTLSEDELAAVLAEERASASAELDPVRAAFEEGDFEETMRRSQTLLDRRPGTKAALVYLAAARELTLRRFWDILGGRERVPRVLVRGEAVGLSRLDHREAFMLSLVDGAATLEELIDMSGLPELDALRLLVRLRARRALHI